MFQEVQCEYELERVKRIEDNKKRLAAIGVLHQKTILDSYRAVKKLNRPVSYKKIKTSESAGVSAPVAAVLSRRSERLSRQKTETCKEEEIDERHREDRSYFDEDGHLVDLMRRGTADGPSTTDEQPLPVYYSQEQRCAAQGRGSIYDSVIGITCHFCRQKKLCGEAGCPRCEARNQSASCIGKTECTRCGSATGRFCRACLLIRYGQDMETACSEMAAGTWLCPHCYEEEHPTAGWICNSSICMKRRGLRPTGIAIYEAQNAGYKSVAHFLQAQMEKMQLTQPAQPGGCFQRPKLPEARADVAAAELTTSPKVALVQEEQPALALLSLAEGKPVEVEPAIKAVPRDGSDSDKENVQPNNNQSLRLRRRQREAEETVQVEETFATLRPRRLR